MQHHLHFVVCVVSVMFSSRSAVCLLFYNSLANHETGKGKLSLQCNAELEEFICDIILLEKLQNCIITSLIGYGYDGLIQLQ